MERDDEKRNRAAELDRFWDIDALLPVRKIPERSRNTEAEEVTVAARETEPPTHRAEPIPPPPEGTVIHPHEAPLSGTSVRRSVFPAPPPAPAGTHETHHLRGMDGVRGMCVCVCVWI